MRLKIDLEIPNWTKWLVGGVAIGLVLGLVGARVYADTIDIKTQFNTGDILSADEMSTNFQKIQAAVNANVTPAGTVVAFAGATPPTGWLLCDGSAVSRTQYPALFAAITVAYGIGDAVSTFNVPDLRAAGIRGVGTSVKFASNATIELAKPVDDRMQGHRHSFEDMDYATQLPFASTKLTWSPGAYTATSAYGRFANAVWEVDTSGVVIGNPYADASNVPPRTGSETTGKAIGMNYIIKY